MAMDDRFRRVGEDFKLHGEVLVVVNDIEEGAGGEDPPPVALVFYRLGDAASHVEEYGPSAVEDALAFAMEQARTTGREVVVQVPPEVDWWPHWGTLVDA
jgi:hypothetical protein